MTAKFIKAQTADQGILEFAESISKIIKRQRKVLWLVCGGSNIPAAVRIMDNIRASVSEADLGNLTVGQTDERYGQIGHADSNWAQMLEAGFNIHKVNTLPILVGKSLEATVSDYNDRLKIAMDDALGARGVIFAIFGIGADGHIAGILPGSPAIDDPRCVTGYEAGSYIRITLTPNVIRKIQVAYAFAFGESKKKALMAFRDDAAAIDIRPAELLKEIGEAYVYSDQF